MPVRRSGDDCYQVDTVVTRCQVTFDRGQVVARQRSTDESFDRRRIWATRVQTGRIVPNAGTRLRNLLAVISSDFLGMSGLAGFLGRVVRRRRVQGTAATGPAGYAAPVADLEALLASHLERVRTAWPKLAMDPAKFSDHVRSIAGAAPAPAQLLGTMYVEDLYLARACLDRVPGAAEHFERLVRSAVGTVVRRMGGASDLKDEIAQKLLTALLVGTRLGGPALADYQGRSGLTLFIRICAKRMALNARRDSRARHRLLDRLSEEIDLAQRLPEEALVKGKLRKPFTAALRSAIERLPERDRVILRLHLVGGVPTRRLATMYNVNQATVSRWVSRARETIWDDVRRELRAKLALDNSAVDSILRTVRSDDDISLSSVLVRLDGEGAP